MVRETYPSALVTGGGALILDEPAMEAPADFSLSLSDGLSAAAAAGAATGATLSAFLAFSPPAEAEAAARAAAAMAARETTPVVDDGAGDETPALSAPTNEVKRTERALATGV